METSYGTVPQVAYYSPHLRQKPRFIKSYLEVLQAEIPHIYHDPDWLFMQDNVPIHMAKMVKEWMTENAICTMTWPPHSPHLKLIEHAWSKLKEMIDRIDPNLENLAGMGDESFEYFFSELSRRESARRGLL